MNAPVHGRLDADDRLTSADDALARLNARAGAEDDRLVLVPVITLARLARRLGTLVSRPVLLADQDTDLEVWLRAQPEADGGVRLTLADWRTRPVASSRSAPVAVESGTGEPPLLTADFAEPLRRALDRPIRRIVATAETLRAADPGEVPQPYRDYARDIADAGRHLQALLEDLVTLNGVEEGVPVAADRIELSEVARRAADLLTVRAGDAGIVVEVDGEAAPAVGDFRRALQIAVNLIGNAITHAPRGSSVRVTCRAADAATLVVDDEGRGVAREDRERIFGQFVRIEPGDTPGSGLGLYISRRLARAMGGDVTAGDGGGGGARFTLALPAA